MTDHRTLYHVPYDLSRVIDTFIPRIPACSSDPDPTP